MNLFIVQPMYGLTMEQIESSRTKVVEFLKAKHPDWGEINVIDTLHHDLPEGSHRLMYLGESIKLLSTADLAFFVHGYEIAKGCNVEFEVCKQYGIRYIREDGLLERITY